MLAVNIMTPIQTRLCTCGHELIPKLNILSAELLRETQSKVLFNSFAIPLMVSLNEEDPSPVGG